MKNDAGPTPACCSHERHGFFVRSVYHPPHRVLYCRAKPILVSGSAYHLSSLCILRLLGCWTATAPVFLHADTQADRVVTWSDSLVASSSRDKSIDSRSPFSAAPGPQNLPPSAVRPKALAIPPSPWDPITAYGRLGTHVEVASEPGPSVQNPITYRKGETDTASITYRTKHANRSRTSRTGHTNSPRTSRPGHTNESRRPPGLGIQRPFLFRYDCTTSRSGASCRGGDK